MCKQCNCTKARGPSAPNGDRRWRAGVARPRPQRCGRPRGGKGGGGTRCSPCSRWATCGLRAGRCDRRSPPACALPHRLQLKREQHRQATGACPHPAPRSSDATTSDEHPARWRRSGASRRLGALPRLRAQVPPGIRWLCCAPLAATSVARLSAKTWRQCGNTSKAKTCTGQHEVNRTPTLFASFL
jgi:hypothetical protein